NAMPGDVERVCDDQIDVSVQPATEDVLAGAGGQTRVPRVLDTNSEEVRSRLNERSDVETESGVSALVLAYAAAIHENFGDLERALKLQPRSASPCIRGGGESCPIPPRPHIKLRRAEVRQIEAMRQSDHFPVGIVKFDF